MPSSRLPALLRVLLLTVPFCLSTQVVAQGPCGGVFPATRDSTVIQAFPTQVLGSNTQLGIGTYNGSVWSYIGFDLGGLGTGIAIHEARLELRVDSTDRLPWPLDLHTATQGWSESTVNWNTRPALSPRLARLNGTVDGGGLASLDVTAIVDGWLASGNLQPTLALLPGATMQLRLGSRESGNGPRLVVSCVDPGGPSVADTLVRNAAQRDALARLRLYSQKPVEIRLDRGAVRSATFLLPYAIPGAAPLDRARAFLVEYQGLLRLDDPDSELQLMRHSPDGRTLIFRQIHDGIPVVPGELAVHTTDCCITGMSGSYVPDITTGSLPLIEADRATSLALMAAGPSAVLAAPARLRYVNPALAGGSDASTYLAWQVAARGGGASEYYVDAATGKVVYSKAPANDAFDLALYTGSRDTTEGASICWWPAATDIQWFDENGVLPGVSPDADGLNAFANIQTVYDYWAATLGRDAHNGSGGKESLYVHVNTGTPANAWYHPFCNIFEFDENWITLDLMAHEFTHGVVRFESDLAYRNESGALNESYADLFGYLVAPQNWTLGENSGMPAASVRTLNDPRAGCPNGTGSACQPEHMSQKSADCTTCTQNNDYGGVHFNSGIHNKAGSLIIAGGSFRGYNVMGLGQTRAARLFYQVLANRLTSNATFLNARDMTIAEAELNPLFGLMDACQVQNAYASVGLGSGDIDCDGADDSVDADDDADGVPDADDNCPTAANGNQADTDGDALADACDDDIDNDGVQNDIDNCDFADNPYQTDQDHDWNGDHCDDSDWDGSLDSRDNCWFIYNPSQVDTDRDDEGDACDTDDDGDGVPDGSDQCPGRANSGQDVDFDGIDNACDNCPTMAPVLPTDADDSDNDGLGNQCDPDDDADGVDDSTDNCPGFYNPSQSDFDFNGDGTGCDSFETQQLYEDKHFWDSGRYVQFEPGFPLDIPLPICPDCFGPELPEKFEISLNLALAGSFQAQVLDGDGRVIAQSMGPELQKTLRFRPASYGISRFDYGGFLLAGKGAGAALTGSASQAAIVRPDQTTYTLRLIPGAGVPTGAPVDFQSTYQECVDADGDGFVGGGPACAPVTTGDCDDANPLIHPGALEVCDGVDNNCDTILDNAAPPSGPMQIDFVGSSLTWDPVPGATGYDILWGGLGALGVSDGNFSGATEGCASHNQPATSIIPAIGMRVGEGVWFLVRPVNCGGGGSYDEPYLMIPSRDAEIEDSAHRCTDCAHPKCQIGPPLADVCGPCESLICVWHPECCADEWSQACVDLVYTECYNLSCGGGTGACDHPLCSPGPPLSPGCDEPPQISSCVTQVCNYDPYCCNVAWDEICVSEVPLACSLGCD